MIVYDVEDEIETNPDYVKENDSTGARDSLTSMSWLLYQLVYNPACLVVPGGAWMGSCIAERGALPRPLLVAESRASPTKLVL
ncbi:hypothetical protein TNCV_2315751 [Trichonephila clavipes]|nr:hypothetical protein TNCV_2315751 [Trichonephila clavipes]